MKGYKKKPRRQYGSIMVRETVYMRKGKPVKRKAHTRKPPFIRGVRFVRGEPYFKTGIWCVSKEKARENAEALRKYGGFKVIIVPKKRGNIPGYSLYISW